MLTSTRANTEIIVLSAFVLAASFIFIVRVAQERKCMQPFYALQALARYCFNCVGLVTKSDQVIYHWHQLKSENKKEKLQQHEDFLRNDLHCFSRTWLTDSPINKFSQKQTYKRVAILITTSVFFYSGHTWKNHCYFLMFVVSWILRKRRSENLLWKLAAR
jgi:hypothetical protein